MTVTARGRSFSTASGVRRVTVGKGSVTTYVGPSAALLPPFGVLTRSVYSPGRAPAGTVAVIALEFSAWTFERRTTSGPRISAVSGGTKFVPVMETSTGKS